MVTLRAKVAWIRCGGRRLAVGESFEVASDRHAAPLLARGDAVRIDANPAAETDPPESQPATPEAGTGDGGTAVTSNPAGASAPAGAEAPPPAKPAKAPKAAKAKSA